MNWIQHIIEPHRLILTWMPSQQDKKRRYAVAELIRSDKNASLHYCTDTSDYKQAIKLRFDGYPDLPIEKSKHEKVLDVFMRRLPPRERRDFVKYLEAIRIPPQSQLSDFALLGYSGAKLPDDNFDIIHPFENVEGPCELLTKIAGFRYYEGINHYQKIQVDAPVHLEPEPSNVVDPHAVMVLLGDIKLGYINTIQAPAVSRWIEQGKNIQAVIERKNGTAERPQIYIFISVN